MYNFKCVFGNKIIFYLEGTECLEETETTFYRVAVLVWHCLPGITPVYLQELYRPVSTLVGRQALRSSSGGGKLLVPRVNTSTMQHRAFSVVAPSIWNSLPSQIRLLPKSYTPLL